MTRLGRIILWTANPLQLPGKDNVSKLGLRCEAPLMWSVAAVTARYHKTPLKRMEVFVLSRVSDALHPPTTLKGKKVSCIC